MPNPSIGLATFIISATISLAGYWINEPVNLTVALLLTLACACMSILPNLDYVPYDKMQAAPVTVNTGGGVKYLEIAIKTQPTYPHFPAPGQHIVI